MVKSVKNKSIFQKFALGYLVLLVSFWVVLHLSGKKTSNYNYLYSLLFSLVPLVGGFGGMFISKKWGRFKSSLGKAIFFISLGLFLWGAGSMVWSYYNFVIKDSLPYPSLADIGFAPSIFFWGLGAVFLSKASGARFAFKKSNWAKVFAVLAPALVLAASYWLLIKVARGGVLVPPGESALKVILDIAYPFGDLTALTLSLVIFGLSFKYFGGFYRLSIIFLLVGLGTMYFGDFVFSYTTTTGSFYNGDWGDLILTFGLFLITFGILGFGSKPALKAPRNVEEA